jgi:hypothetical protein
MVTETELLECGAYTSLHFCFWVWMKGELYKSKQNTRDELLADSLDAAVRLKIREDQLRRTTRNHNTRHAKGTEADGGIFEHLSRTITNQVISV